ncbi:thiamine diphosphokinase [Vallitalea okinawensis]|uniref:thiamine diphosphokinase n=1 Tax=Vallitalea okinawensis TaxID=2078660 RepID=UPI000CFD709E|nr:thiamine diphosphokinase [Vallitalea okinawensis]
MTIIVITGGMIKNYEQYDETIKLADYIICADGGLRHMKEWRRNPDLIMGDFDSCDHELLSEYEAKKITVLRYPTDKDYTDTELALNEAIKRGAKDIIILGGTGTRLDHTLGNIHSLVQAMNQNITAQIIDDHNHIQIIQGDRVIEKQYGQYLSLIPLTSEVKGLTTTGLKYELKDYTLTYGRALGVSNEIVGDEVTISTKGGILVIIQSRD